MVCLTTLSGAQLYSGRRYSWITLTMQATSNLGLPWPKAVSVTMVWAQEGEETERRTWRRRLNCTLLKTNLDSIPDPPDGSSVAIPTEPPGPQIINKYFNYIIGAWYNNYISNEGLLEEWDKEENLEATGGGGALVPISEYIIIIISNLSNDRSKTSSKTIPPHSAI